MIYYTWKSINLKTYMASFSKESVDFLKGLKKNNDKAWFDAHRETYQKYLKKESEQFAKNLGEELQKIAPKLHVEPRVNGSIYRISRDIRFSKDKTPYKTHAAFFFWEGPGGRKEAPGFYVMLRPERIMVGVGLYRFSKQMLDRYRAAVTEEGSGDEFHKIFFDLQRQGYDTGTKHYKRVPRGFEDDQKNAEYLKYNSIHAGIDLEDVKMDSEKLLQAIVSECKKLSKLHRWLVDEVALKIEK